MYYEPCEIAVSENYGIASTKLRLKRSGNDDKLRNSGIWGKPQAILGTIHGFIPYNRAKESSLFLGM